MAGSDYTCALISGTIKCLGDNTAITLAPGPAPAPMSISGIFGTVTAMDGGARHACALVTGGTVYCWGDNDQGQLGNGTLNRDGPHAVPGVSGATKLSVGALSTCVVANGAARCWGGNSYGQTTGATSATVSPLTVAGLGTVTDVTSGELTACAVAGGKASCWGDNSKGQLGLGDALAVHVSTPQPWAGGITNPLSRSGNCLVDTSGKLYCWGESSFNRLGNGWAPTSAGGTFGTPVLSTIWDEPLKNVAEGQVAVDPMKPTPFLCVLTQAGAVKCRGGGAAGSLGNGTLQDSAVPVTASGMGSDVVSLTAHQDRVCATKSDGTAWCWGSGNPVPTRLQVTGSVRSVVLPSQQANDLYLLMADGTVKWRDGNGSVRPTGMTGITSLVADVVSACGTNGTTVRCWTSYSGELVENPTFAGAQKMVIVGGLPAGLAGTNLVLHDGTVLANVTWADTDVVLQGGVLKSIGYDVPRGDLWFSATPKAVA